MEKNKVPLWAPVLVMVAAVLLVTVGMSGVDAARPEVKFAYQLYGFDDGTFVVDYVVQGKGGGNMDLAVSHECFSGSEQVQDWTNRLYWSGNGAKQEGHWNTEVQAGNECFAVVVDLDQPMSSDVSEMTSGYAEVSPRVSYVVQ